MAYFSCSGKVKLSECHNYYISIHWNIQPIFNVNNRVMITWNFEETTNFVQMDGCDQRFNASQITQFWGYLLWMVRISSNSVSKFMTLWRCNVIKMHLKHLTYGVYHVVSFISSMSSIHLRVSLHHNVTKKIILWLWILNMTTWSLVRAMTSPLKIHGEIGWSSIASQKKLIERLFWRHRVWGATAAWMIHM